MTEPVTYAPDTVLTVEQLAAALQVSVSHVEKQDFPTVYLGRLKRYVWGQVVEILKERAA